MMPPGSLPLAGLRVAVTRPQEDADELAALLEQAGAEAVLLPLTRILPPAGDEALRQSVAELDRYDWIVFTSAGAVRAVAQAAVWRRPRARIAVVGAATAAAVRELTGRAPDVMPSRSTGSAIVSAMLEHGSLAGVRILWPRAELARPELPRSLAEAGAMLDAPVAYRTVADTAAAASLARSVQAGDLDVITFTAPSAVECYADAGGTGAECVIAVIGPTTAAAARARGLPVHVEPEQPIISALVAALAGYHDSGSPQ